jgi:hypothetical protein
MMQLLRLTDAKEASGREGMRQEYSTTGARKQEALGGQGLSIGVFLPEWDYQICFGFRGCRGADAPSVHAGVFGKGGLLEGFPHCFTPLELYFTTKRSMLPESVFPSSPPWVYLDT